MRLIKELTNNLQNYLNWHKSRISCAAQILQSMILNKTVSLPHLAVSFKGRASSESSYRRLKRFFSFDFDISDIIDIVLNIFDFQEITLIMDRTNWKLGKININILFISIAYKGISIPIFWNTMSKRGNSNSQERIDLLKKVFSKIEKTKIKAFVADREFIGRDWIKFLIDEKITFVIRIRNDAKIEGCIPANILFRKARYNKKIVPKIPIKLWGNFLYISASKSKEGELMILASNKKFKDPHSIYKKRWEIEVMFQCLKGRGFDLEKTHITNTKKVDRLIFLLTMVFSWMYKMGEIKIKEKPIKVKKHGRLAKSIFRYGFDEIRRMLFNLQRYSRRFYRWLYNLCDYRRKCYV